MATRKLVPVLATLVAVILLLDAGWAVFARVFGWYHGHVIIFLSMVMYIVAGFVAYDCGGRVLSALAGAVLCIVDNTVGTLITWCILPAPVARTLPSIPDLAPMLAASVVLALALGLIGGLLAATRHHLQERRRSTT
ncbi:MAG: hypothetical protein ACREL4_08520 [Gemmatimonadales bacterium]